MMTNGTDEFGVYKLLQSLGKYLNTGVGITCGKITRNLYGASGWKTIDADGYSIIVTISNTAPMEPSYPLVVFLAVGLEMQFPNVSPRTIQRMRKEGNLKVDLSNAYPQQNPFPPSGAIRVDNPEYPPLTSDELKHGHVLFPSQAIKYELSLTTKACPNVKELKLWAEGTVSRRHLFYHSREIQIASDNIVYQL
ncbi:hypothetical protein ACFLV6_00250 [Chloroflexota bacterium]